MACLCERGPAGNGGMNFDAMHEEKNDRLGTQGEGGWDANRVVNFNHGLTRCKNTF